MRTRSHQPEWMDGDLAQSEAASSDFAAVLADLATVNTVTLARLPTLGFMRRVARRHPGRTLRVLDVACGEGDMLRRIHRWAARTGHAVELTGLDLNPLGIAAARAATPPDVPIQYRCADIFAPGLGSYDVVLSALFTHHLDDDQVVAFLRLMETHATLGWFVNDLHRDTLAYYGFCALSALARWHPMVQHDGAISVTRSFRRADWVRLINRAGLSGMAQIRWQVPFRYCVTQLK